MATINKYEIPSWASKPPAGLHLDVMKEEKLIQKLMIDEKRCYFFGRNPQLCDFSIDHHSCSRVHAAFVYHKSLDRAFLVDLGSTHGTFIGTTRIESYKPTPLPRDMQFHFGHSSRVYVLREKPQISRPVTDEVEEKMDEEEEARLKEEELALDNLTEFNTAQNRRVILIGITSEASELNTRRDKKRRKYVCFNEEEEIINPEDVDPSVGRFRNLVQSTVVKKRKLDTTETPREKTKSVVPAREAPFNRATFNQLYYDIPGVHYNEYERDTLMDIGGAEGQSTYSSKIVAKLDLPLPNPAPDVDEEQKFVLPEPPSVDALDMHEVEKKRYKKESWPGKKHMVHTMLV